MIQEAFDFSTSSDDWGTLYCAVDADGRGYVKPGRTGNLKERSKQHRRSGLAVELHVYVPDVSRMEKSIHDALEENCPEARVAGREYWAIPKADNPSLLVTLIIEGFEPFCRMDPERRALDDLNKYLSAIAENEMYRRSMGAYHPDAL